MKIAILQCHHIRFRGKKKDYLLFITDSILSVLILYNETEIFCVFLDNAISIFEKSPKSNKSKFETLASQTFFNKKKKMICQMNLLKLSF